MGTSPVRLVVLDVDGVLTDGSVTLDGAGRESKRLHFHDIDAVFRLRRQGLRVALLTGEAGPIAEAIRDRLSPDVFHSGVRDKAGCLRALCAAEGLSPQAVCFMGDSLHDLGALELAGLAACPADGLDEARALADLVTTRPAGRGAVAELARFLVPVPSSKQSEGVGAWWADHLGLVRSMRAGESARGVEEAARRIGATGASGTVRVLGVAAAAALASHLATELKRAGVVRALGVAALGSDAPSPPDAEDLGGPGDLSWVIAVDPAEPAAREALRGAGAKGVTTVLLSGSGDGAGRPAAADLWIEVPSRSPSRTLEAQLLVGHCIAGLVSEGEEARARAD